MQRYSSFWSIFVIMDGSAVLAYGKYLKNRVGAHQLHSPFLFQMYTQVFQHTADYQDTAIREERRKLSKSAEVIEITDLGAGSRVKDSDRRKVSEIAKNAAIPAKYGRLLGKIIQFYQLEKGLELGTSLGIGSAYFALNNPKFNLITVEGCQNISDKAAQFFDCLKIKSIQQVTGSFDDELPTILQENKSFDFIYVDGNHTYEATKKYASMLKACTHDDTFLVFDDIHWSKGMEQAWSEIIQDEDFHVTIDLYRMGIVLKKPGQVKQHFVLKY